LRDDEANKSNDGGGIRRLFLVVGYTKARQEETRRQAAANIVDILIGLELGGIIMGPLMELR
jgi:hypothetical protein